MWQELLDGEAGRPCKDSFSSRNAIWKSVRLLRQSRADLVIGTGGYFSPPVVLAAWLLRIGRVILEPNAIPGLANRVLGPVANRVFLAFESGRTYFNPSKTRIVGTPVRKEFFDSDFSPTVGTRKTLLVVGGSQGARAINSALIEALRLLTCHAGGSSHYSSNRFRGS